MPDHDAFLSYSWRDHEAVEAVARELADRKLRVFLDRWYLTPWQAGRRELEEKLGQSACAVIFLGPGDLGNWQERELDVALDRDAKSHDFPVIPVLLPGGDPPLGFLAMNTWVDMRDGVQGPAIDALDAAIRGRPAGPNTVLASDVAPYRGLQPFREQDADFFYGREAFTETLAETVSRQTLVAVVGPSGSGKSSVVRAGLVPRLRRAKDGTVWEVATLVPGHRPLQALAASLIGLLEPELTERLVEVRRIAEGLATGTIELPDIVASVLEQQPGTDRLLLVADQWEELYTLTTDDAARRSFIDALLAATEGQSRLTVVMTMRGDFVGTAIGYRPLSDRLQGAQVNLSTMTTEETERAMTEPARKVGLEFEPGLVTRILDDIGDEPGTLPLLEFVLAELWRDRARGRLRHSTYEEIGGARGAMAARADEVVGGLPAADQERVRHLLLHLVQPGAGTIDTRRRATLDEIGAETESIVNVLAGSRLLVTGRDETTGEETVEVAHEALIQHWGRLREWVDRDREFLMWRRRIESALDDWEATGKDEGSLLRGAALAEAERWLGERSADLGPAERDFVERSAALRRSEVARDRRRRRLVGTAAMAVLAIVSALAIVAFVAWQLAQSAQSDAESALADAEEARAEAEANLEVAESRELAARANAATATDPQLALLLAAEAYQRSPTFESRDAIARAQAAWADALLLSHGDPLSVDGWATSVAYSPDSKVLATGDSEGNVRLWDVAERLPRGKPLTGHTGSVLSVAFVPDEQGQRYLASGSEDGTVRVWNWGNGELLAKLDHGDAVWTVAFSPDGGTLASAGEDGMVRLWDVASFKQVGDPLEGHDGNVYRVAFSPDGTLASAGADGIVRIWDAVPPSELKGHEGSVWGLAYSPDGKTLASAGGDKSIRLWNVADGKQIGDPLEGHGSTVNSVAFCCDGEFVVSTGFDRTIRVWDVETQTEIANPLVGHTANVREVAVGPDDNTLATASQDRTVRLWGVRSLLSFHGYELPGHASKVWNVAFAPEEGPRYLASAGEDGTALVWEFSGAGQFVNGDPELLYELAGHGDAVWYLHFSPDGETLATTTDNGTVTLWDLADGRPLGEPVTGVVVVAFEPEDGRLLASAGEDGKVRLWDLSGNPPLDEPLGEHEGEVSYVLFSPDGETLASAGGSDGAVRLWDVDSRQLVREFGGHEDAGVWYLGFSPDGETLVSVGKDGTVLLWDVGSGTALGDLPTGSADFQSALAFSPDGKTLAYSHYDWSVRLWDVEGQKPKGVPLEGHSRPVSRLGYSPDGSILVSQDDETLRLWDAAKGLPIGEPFSREGRMSIGALSKDGALIAAGTEDGAVLLWDVPTFEAACALAMSGPQPEVPEFLKEKGIDHWACEDYR